MKTSTVKIFVDINNVQNLIIITEDLFVFCFRLVVDMKRGVYYQKCHDPECRAQNFKSLGGRRFQIYVIKQIQSGFHKEKITSLYLLLCM